MPTYCYKTEEGETAEAIFAMGEAPEMILVGGQEAVRDFQAEQGGAPRSTGSGWPMAPCFASGVNAAQAPELRKFLADRGCPTEVTSDGDPVYRSPAHQKKALGLRNLHNKAGT